MRFKLAQLYAQKITEASYSEIRILYRITQTTLQKCLQGSQKLESSKIIMMVLVFSIVG